MSIISPNRLISEKSPYLLQHAYNPVNWYPWGPEAFERADKEDKPIFLSIGYSTCHWCHVMEKESFEDLEVATLMNGVFVCIKVDREERPDIDSAYMTVCQMMTGSGGWPLTIIMTPDKKPFFAATYIPKETRFGRSGIKDLIFRIEELWKTHREETIRSAEKVVNVFKQATSGSPGDDLGETTLRMAYEQLSRNYDEQHGGFGNAPKFPTPHNLLFLLRYWKRKGDEQILRMVEKTLTSMRRGGIYDHIGFGFHRYATDKRWLIPHFEKMLYDQVLLSMAYTEAYQSTAGKKEYEQTAREILTYVLRDMTDAEGGFYSAEDADSEGEEGKFYLWSEEEIGHILATKEAELFTKVFNIERDGNFQEEATEKRTGKNILHLKKSLDEISSELRIPSEELYKRLEETRAKLFAAREKRIHPHKDDKILTDWNGLMIAALAKGAQVFDEPQYEKAARQSAHFVFTKMFDANGRLYHRYRDGEAAIPAFLDDYAFMIWGLLELYETTLEPIYLQRALDLNTTLLRHFWDHQKGGFYFTADDADTILVRKKEIYDGAIPSGNSVSMLNLLRLARLTANTGFEAKAAQIVRAFSEKLSEAPFAYTQMMVALDFTIGPSYEVVIVGNRHAEDTKAMFKALRNAFIPNKVVLYRPADEEASDITRIAEFTKDFVSKEGKATAYVCKNYTCELPTTDAQKMLMLMNEKVT